MEFNSVLIGGLVGIAPNLAFWIAVIVLGGIILRRGGDQAERFILTGASLKLVSNLLNIPAAAIVPWLVQGGASIEYANRVTMAFGIGRGLVSTAGVICLAYAFWVKFRAGNVAAAESINEEVASQY